jgi:hypothetical protein
MKLLTQEQLMTLEIMLAGFENNPYNRWITTQELAALQQALPRWIAMERTVTEAHVDAARETGSAPYWLGYPEDPIPADDFWDQKGYPPSLWLRFKRWCRRQAALLEDVLR